MSISDDRMSSIFSVHCPEDGSQSTFFRARLRLRMCVRRRLVLERSERIFATELPTVPKPRRATLQIFRIDLLSPKRAAVGSRSVAKLITTKGTKVHEGNSWDESQRATLRLCF